MTQDRNGDRHVFGSHDGSTHPGSPARDTPSPSSLLFSPSPQRLSSKRVLPTSDFLFLILGVALAAWYGVRGPGILATALSLLVINYAIDTQVGLVRISRFTDVLEVGAFLIKALIVVGTIEALRRARGLAESRAEKLEQVNEELRHALVFVCAYAGAELIGFVRLAWDGGVHALFTLTGRTGAAGCNLTQPDFATELANNNVIFRIPTPTFGAGLIVKLRGVPTQSPLSRAVAEISDAAADGSDVKTEWCSERTRARISGCVERRKMV